MTLTRALRPKRETTPTMSPTPQSVTLRILSGVLATLASLSGLVPDSLERLWLGVLVLVLVDTAMGYWKAKRACCISTSIMRNFCSKMMQYGGLSVLFGFIALVTSNWTPMYACGMVVAGIEANSIIENIIVLQKYGVDFGPFNAVLDKIRRYFLVAQDLMDAIPAPKTGAAAQTNSEQTPPNP